MSSNAPAVMSVHRPSSVRMFANHIVRLPYLGHVVKPMSTPSYCVSYRLAKAFIPSVFAQQPLPSRHFSCSRLPSEGKPPVAAPLPKLSSSGFAFRMFFYLTLGMQSRQWWQCFVARGFSFWRCEYGAVTGSAIAVFVADQVFHHSLKDRRRSSPAVHTSAPAATTPASSSAEPSSSSELLNEGATATVTSADVPFTNLIQTELPFAVRVLLFAGGAVALIAFNVAAVPFFIGSLKRFGRIPFVPTSYAQTDTIFTSLLPTAKLNGLKPLYSECSLTATLELTVCTVAAFAIAIGRICLSRCKICRSWLRRWTSGDRSSPKRISRYRLWTQSMVGQKRAICHFHTGVFFFFIVSNVALTCPHRRLTWYSRRTARKLNLGERAQFVSVTTPNQRASSLTNRQ